jgi:hypothetical protein
MHQDKDITNRNRIKMTTVIPADNFKIEWFHSILKTGVSHLFFNLISKDFCLYKAESFTQALSANFTDFQNALK